MGSTTIGGNITKRIHSFSSECSSALPLKQSKKVNCSLDFLAAIAYEHAKSLPQLDVVFANKNNNSESESSGGMQKTDTENKNSVKSEFSELDGDANEVSTEASDTCAPSNEYNAYNPVAARVHARVATKYAEAAERHAAAALAMAGHSTKDVILEKTPKFSKSCASAKPRENYTARGRRLQQNQIYRKQLRERGVYPIKTSEHKFKCSLCDKIFDKEMFVWRHGVKHLGSKPFQCTRCLSTFNRSDSLQRHVRNFHLQDADDNECFQDTTSELSN